MQFKSALTAALLIAAPAAAQPPPDIFVLDRTIAARPSLQRLTANLLLGRPGAAGQLERSLARSGERGEARLDAYLQLCGFYFREQRYADGLRVCTAADAIKKGSAGNMIDLLRAFAQAGPVRWSAGAVRIPLK
ncbi:MAG TPA: hypothetical protein VM757_02625, partial [Sphingomicrobium sp.]|nr:hypothetical protein [Sphingomicrobium sp.]